jgi:hypothetical protein
MWQSRRIIHSQRLGSAERIERFIHRTGVPELGQLPNQDAVPSVGLREMSLTWTGGNGTAAVENPFCGTALKRRNAFVLTNRTPTPP